MTKYEPYKEGDKHYIDVDPDDELNYVAVVTKWLEDNQTEALSFAPVVAGCEVLQKGLPQGDRGSLLPVKLKVTFDVVDAHCTFRVKTTDGQQFDKTIWFKKVEN